MGVTLSRFLFQMIGGILQIEKIVKLLRLSESSNDNESLAAIRAANKILRAHGETWDFLTEFQKTKPKKTSFNEMSVDELFDEIENMEIGSEFIDSLRDFYEERGFLTPKQLIALRKTVMGDY